MRNLYIVSSDWHVPFHIFHFSKNTLSKILNNNGFKITKETQQSPSLWLTQSIISRLFGKPNRPTKHLRKAALVAPLMIFIRFLLFPFLCISASGVLPCRLILVLISRS